MRGKFTLPKMDNKTQVIQDQMEVFLELTKDDENLDDKHPQTSTDQDLPPPRKRSKTETSYNWGWI